MENVKRTYEHFTTHIEDAVTVWRPDDSAVRARFSFSDDRWQLLDQLQPAQATSLSTINFGDLPAWLKDAVKLYIAHLWLEEDTPLGTIKNIRVVTGKLGRQFPSLEGSARQLRRHHGTEMQRVLLNDGMKNKTLCDQIYLLNRFGDFLRALYPDEPGLTFRLDVPVEREEPEKRRLLKNREIAQILDACAQELSLWQANPSDCRLQSNALIALAVILSICTGRRPIEICQLPLDTRTEWYVLENEIGEMEEGLLIRFVDGKHQKIYIDVFCPGLFGRMALYAIQTAKEITVLLRGQEQKDTFLFLIPSSSGKSQVLSTFRLLTSLTGTTDRVGLWERYEIFKEAITCYHFRGKRATSLKQGGCTLHEICEDLNNLNPDNVVKHYILDDEETDADLKRKRGSASLHQTHLATMPEMGVVDGGLDPVLAQRSWKQNLIVLPSRYGYMTLNLLQPPPPDLKLAYLGGAGEVDADDSSLTADDAFALLSEEHKLLEANLAYLSGKPEHDAWQEECQSLLALIVARMQFVTRKNHTGRLTGEEHA
jgi:hypothetical protein